MGPSSPLDRVRARLASFRATEAALAVAQLRGEPDAEADRDAGRARAALATGENRADLDEARSLGLLDPETEALLLVSIADAARTEAMARATERPIRELAILAASPVVLEGRQHALASLAAEAAAGPLA